MNAHTSSLVTVAAHLKEATDRTSELLATLSTEPDRISPEMILDTVRELSSAILGELWGARWAMPIEVDDDPQRMNVADWPRQEDDA